MSSRRLRFGCVAVLACGLVLLGQSAPAQEAPAGDAPPKIGELTIQTIPARHYLHGSIETDFPGMVEPLRKTLRAMFDGGRENRVPVSGPIVHFYYDGPHSRANQKFKMETGVFVPPDTKAFGEFMVRELPEFKCATMLYVGPGRRIGDSWQALYRAVRAKGLTPTGEERELYLYFEGSDSPNNIVQVQVGVK